MYWRLLGFCEYWKCFGHILKATLELVERKGDTLMLFFDRPSSQAENVILLIYISKLSNISGKTYGNKNFFEGEHDIM